ncbi:probable low affinity copper uptake protein 2 isoform X2 [Mya arenaria]|uniref:probable low affinity copper uptake protein 2 isoform X2 n=1 Tax=Mya arenaria TaxID=6604 RepID=UPI0022E2BC6F|nr:probable low affinity copper uptake protein 2 isoform X2 [Mya arenaria]
MNKWRWIICSKYFTLHFQGDFLIKDVKISAPSGLVVAMISVVVLTALLEGINYWFLLKQAARPATFANKSKRSSSLVDGSLHVLYAVHKMLTVALSYTVMLCVMSMNAWILVAAVIGAGVGYLLLRPAVASCFPVSVPVKNVREVKVDANRVNGTVGTEEGEMDSFLEEDDSKNANHVIHNNFPTDGLLQNYPCVETV